tara:strand:+ start:7804 stop:8583 length:780 start_codon:yes stop_codon:yes gene_type:complete
MAVAIKKVKIVWPKTQLGGYSEVYSSGLKYALCSDKNEQATGFVWCKDFLQDAYLAYFNQGKQSIYGFSYSFSTDRPLSTQSTKLLLANRSDKRFHAKMKKARDFVNQVEKELKMVKKTVLYQATDPPKAFEECGVFLMEGNKRWHLSPPMISLYTLLIRVGSKHLKKHGTWRDTCQMMIDGKVSPYQSSDREQIQTAMKGIDHILKHNDRTVFGKDVKKNYPNGIATHSMHNDSGICAFSNGYNSGTFPGWYSIPFES